jgi:hypothetical protein
VTLQLHYLPGLVGPRPLVDLDRTILVGIGVGALIGAASRAT